METKQLLFDEDARRRMYAGVRQLTQAVKVTLGRRLWWRRRDVLIKMITQIRKTDYTDKSMTSAFGYLRNLLVNLRIGAVMPLFA